MSDEVLTYLQQRLELIETLRRARKLYELGRREAQAADEEENAEGPCIIRSEAEAILREVDAMLAACSRGPQ